MCVLPEFDQLITCEHWTEKSLETAMCIPGLPSWPAGKRSLFESGS